MWVLQPRRPHRFPAVSAAPLPAAGCADSRRTSATPRRRFPASAGTRIGHRPAPPRRSSAPCFRQEQGSPRGAWSGGCGLHGELRGDGDTQGHRVGGRRGGEEGRRCRGPSGVRRRGGRRGEHGREGDLFVCMGSMQTEWRTASNGDVLWQMNTKFECDGAKTIFFSVQGQKSPLNGVLHLIFPYIYSWGFI